MDLYSNACGRLPDHDAGLTPYSSGQTKNFASARIYCPTVFFSTGKGRIRMENARKRRVSTTLKTAPAPAPSLFNAINKDGERASRRANSPKKRLPSSFSSTYPFLPVIVAMALDSVPLYTGGDLGPNRATGRAHQRIRYERVFQI
jgi:hypothetical protein